MTLALFSPSFDPAVLLLGCSLMEVTVGIYKDVSIAMLIITLLKTDFKKPSNFSIRVPVSKL